MNLTVKRQQGDALCTPGEMLVDGMHFGYTLEPRRDQSQGKPFCVPAGTYQLVMGWSVHFNMLVPQVIAVPDFTGVEIHPGNYARDTHGCCLVGEIQSTDFVGQSRWAFDTLVAKLLNSSGPHSITYTDPIIQEAA